MTLPALAHAPEVHAHYYFTPTVCNIQAASFLIAAQVVYFKAHFFYVNVHFLENV